MKEHSRVFLGAALLLLLLEGCATTGVESDRAQEEAASIEAEIEALSQSFWNRLNLRFKEYYDEAMKGKAELNSNFALLYPLTSPIPDHAVPPDRSYYDEAMKGKAELNRWYGVDDEKARRSVDRNGEMVGRMQFIANLKKLQPSASIEQWVAGELDRITNEKADAELDVASARTQIAIWKANRVAIDEESLRVRQMGDRALKLGTLRGEELEAKLVIREIDAYLTDAQEVYRRAELQQQAELRRQQAILLFLGGLQQISRDMQQQQQYNQQQIYQQRLLHELSKPTTCHSYGATTTCD